jgi:hypothetical protein
VSAVLKDRMMRGYMIPRSMEWIYWPLGYRPATPEEVTGVEGDVIERTTVVIPTIPVSDLALMNQLDITNRAEWMETLRKLGAIR